MQMIRCFWLFLLFCFPLVSFSQTNYPGDTVFVDPCATNCMQNNAVYGATTAFHTRNIISDFGPRNHASFWHGGIDFTAENGNDHGYHVLSVEAGTLRRWRGETGQKYPEILGTDMHLMYNHCFTSAVVTTTNSLREGDVELVRLDNNLLTSHYRFGVIHYSALDTTLIAACPNGNCANSIKLINPTVIGGITSYDTLVASNIIADKQVIGSLGTSAATPVVSHLHLQRFRNVAGSAGFNPYHRTNLIDPLEEVRHQGPTYDVEILKNVGTAPNYIQGVKIDYPGSVASKFLVRPMMQDLDANGNVNNGIAPNFIYLNNTMNIDRTELKIKKSHESNYALIRGAELESKIWLGSRFNHDVHYPSTTNNNVHIHDGSWNRSTVRPYCYSSRNGRWDDYFFNDFITRIHSNDPMSGGGGQPLISDMPDDSRYSDGMYNVIAEVTDIRDSVFVSISSNFILDNFQPFITRIEFSTNGVNRCSLDRNQSDSSTQANDGILTNDATVNDIMQLVNSNYLLEVSVSEPVDSLFAEYRLLGTTAWQDGHSLSLANINDPLNYVWLPLQTLGEGDYEFRFKGEDKSGNDLMNVYAMTGNNSVNVTAGIPTRLSATTWANEDANHQSGYDFIVLEINPACAVGNHLTSVSNVIARSSVVANCSDLDGVETEIVYDCVLDNYTIELTGVNEDEFEVFLQLPNGDYEAWDYSNIVSDTGTYCYLVYSDDPCCFKSACIHVKEMPVFEVNVIGFESPTICGKSDFGTLIPCNGSIDIEVISADSNYDIRWSKNNEFLSAEEDIDALCGGEYILQVSNNFGCEFLDTFDLCCCFIELGFGGLGGFPSGCATSLVEFNADVTNADSENSNDGSIQLEVLPSNALLSFLWTNAFGEVVDSTESIFNLNPSTYCVEIDNGCMVQTECFNVLNENCEETFELNASIIDACNGESNGSIYLNPAPAELALAFGPYSYSWSDGSSESSITGLSVGQVCVTVTNEIGCQVENCFEVENDNVFIANSDVVNVTDQTLGSIQLSIVGDYNSVTWSNGASGTFIDQLENGVYVVTITTDNHNCVITDWYYVGDDCHTFQFEFTVIDGCNGQGSISLDLDESNHLIRWFKGNTIIDSGNTLNSLSSGEYCAVIELENGSCEKCFTINNENDVSLNVNYSCGVLDIEIISGVGPFILDVDIFEDLFVEVLSDVYDYTGEQRFHSLEINNDRPAEIQILVSSESCQSQDEVAIDHNPINEFQVSIPPQNIESNCIDGSSSGSAEVEVLGNTGPYFYSWTHTIPEVKIYDSYQGDNGWTDSLVLYIPAYTVDYGTSSSISIVDDGTYCVTVTDACNHTGVDCVFMDCFDDDLDPYESWSCPPFEFGMILEEDDPCLNSWDFFNQSEIKAKPQWSKILGTITITWPDGTTSYFKNNNGQKSIIGSDHFDIDDQQPGEYNVQVYADWLGQEVTCIKTFFPEFEICDFITPSPIDNVTSGNLGLGYSDHYITGCYSCTGCGNSPTEIELYNLSNSIGAPYSCEDYQSVGFTFIPNDLDNPCTGGGDIIYTCPCDDSSEITVTIPASDWGVYLDLNDVWFLDWNENEIGYPSPYSVPRCALGACIFDPQMVDGTVLDSEFGDNPVLAFICIEPEEMDTIVPDIGLDTLCKEGNIQFIPSYEPCVLEYYCLDDPTVIYTVDGTVDLCFIETDTTCIFVQYCDDNCDIIFEDISYTFELCVTTPNPCSSCIVEQREKFSNGYVPEIRGDNNFDLENEIEFNLFPNPVQDVLILRTEGEIRDERFKILIYNINGALVSTEFIDARQQISFDVSSFANGVYLLRVAYGQNNKVLKFHKI